MASACYRLHETMREYARLRLREAGEEDAVEAALRRATTCRAALLFAAEGRYRLLDWLGWTELEIDNIRAVLPARMDRRDVAARHRSRHVPDLVLGHPRDEPRACAGSTSCSPGQPRRPAHPWVYFVSRLPRRAAERPGSGHAGAGARRSRRPERRDRQVRWRRSLAMASIAANMAGDRASSRRLLDEARAVADGLDDLGATPHDAPGASAQRRPRRRSRPPSGPRPRAGRAAQPARPATCTAST